MICDGNVTTRVELSALLTVAFSNPTRTKFLSIKKMIPMHYLTRGPKFLRSFFLCLVRTVGRNLKHFPPYFCLYWCIIYFFAKAISSRHFYTTHFIRRSLFWPQNFHSQLTLIAHHTPSREQIVRESSNTETIRTSTQRRGLDDGDVLRCYKVTLINWFTLLGTECPAHMSPPSRRCATFKITLAG